MQSSTAAPVPSQPYGRCNGYHRPRPKFTQAVTAPSTLQVESVVVETQPVIKAKPLPSRPANHLQQQHGSKSYDPSSSATPIHQRFAKVHLESEHQQAEVPEEEEELLYTRIETLQDEEATPTRPSLTSKFSFDNLTAMDNQSAGGALKKMATKAWLQSIAQAARSSTYSTSSTMSPAGNQNRAPTRPGTPNELHQLSTSPERSKSHSHSHSQSSSSSFLNFRSRETKEASKPVTSMSRMTRSQSPSKQQCTTAPTTIRPKVMMTISNPELVHPATGGTLYNSHLGEGARRVGLPAEAFAMTPAASSHRIYRPPSSPPPRRSEDSVRSLETSTSTAISYGSTSTASTSTSNSASLAFSGNNASRNRPSGRQDRELPYLPLRIKNVDGSRNSSDDARTSHDDIIDDVIEQLVPTPGLPPESAKYIFNHLYSREKSTKESDGEAAGGKKVNGERTNKTPENMNDEIPFGHSALSRPTSASKQDDTISTTKDMIGVISPTSPAFARISPLSSSRKKDFPNETNAQSGNTCPPRPSLLGNTQHDSGTSSQKQNVSTSAEKPFHAMLLQPVPVFPADLSDDEKLVNVHVGGSKVFTTRLSAITSHADSHLAKFLQTRLHPQEGSSSAVSTGEVKQENDAKIHKAPLTVEGSVKNKSKQPHMVEQFPTPAMVTLHMPTSPIHALRSARASIFNDVPSDAGGEDTNEPVDINVFGNYASVNIFREKLDVPLPPFPNPRKGGMRFTRFTNLSSTSLVDAGEERNITASSSEYASTEMDDEDGNALDNFLDTTPDEEPEDPFHFQGQSASPMPSTADLREKSKRSEEVEKSNSELARDSHYSTHTPSLSSSPNSSAYQVDSPILLSSASTRLNGGDAFQHLITQHEQHILHPLNVYLDRSAESYDAIFHWLRNGSLPRRLCLDDAINVATMHGAGDDKESIQAILNNLPTETRKKIMPLVLHPIVSEVKDLRDEAAYLGFYALVSACDTEIAKLRKAIRWSRNIVGHPGMHVRSESEGGTTSTARLLAKQANRPRPRLVGHRHYDSESKVMPRPENKAAHDNWI